MTKILNMDIGFGTGQQVDAGSAWKYCQCKLKGLSLEATTDGSNDNQEKWGKRNPCYVVAQSWAIRLSVVTWKIKKGLAMEFSRQKMQLVQTGFFY